MLCIVVCCGSPMLLCLYSLLSSIVLLYLLVISFLLLSCLIVIVMSLSCLVLFLSFCLPPLLLLLLLYLSASYLLLPTILFASALLSSSTNLPPLLLPAQPLTRLASAQLHPTSYNTRSLTLASHLSPLSFAPASPPTRLKLCRK